MDERFLAVNVKGKGLLVFTACSHAGLINVLTHAQASFPDTRLYAVMREFHLSGPGPEKIIPDTVRDIGRFGLTMIIPGHCTGWRAVTAVPRNSRCAIGGRQALFVLTEWFAGILSHA